MSDASALPRPVGLAAGRDVWVVVPTYNERENLERLVTAVLESLPDGRILIVDDASPDGTGELADELAARQDRMAVLHRAGKEGLGVAYRAGFRWALDQAGTAAVVQMDADFSHDPADLSRLLAPLMTDTDLVLGSRYVPGGGTVGWPLRRRLISKGGTAFARLILWLPFRDLTGGFKAWRAELLGNLRLRESAASGYGFQIETTWWAYRRRAVIREVPIVFREREVGISKMGGGIIAEAFVLVFRLRWQAIVNRRRGGR